MMYKCMQWMLAGDDVDGGVEWSSKVHIELCCVLIYLMDESSKEK